MTTFQIILLTLVSSGLLFLIFSRRRNLFINKDYTELTDEQDKLSHNQNLFLDRLIKNEQLAEERNQVLREEISQLREEHWRQGMEIVTLQLRIGQTQHALTVAISHIQMLEHSLENLNQPIPELPELIKEYVNGNITVSSISRQPWSRLANNIKTSFDNEELDSLLFDLNVEPSEIKDISINERARKTIQYFTKRGRLNDLMIMLKEHRPNIDWEK